MLHALWACRRRGSIRRPERLRLLDVDALLQRHQHVADCVEAHQVAEPEQRVTDPLGLLPAAVVHGPARVHQHGVNPHPHIRGDRVRPGRLRGCIREARRRVLDAQQLGCSRLGREQQQRGSHALHAAALVNHLKVHSARLLRRRERDADLVVGSLSLGDCEEPLRTMAGSQLEVWSQRAGQRHHDLHQRAPRRRQRRNERRDRHNRCKLLTVTKYRRGRALGAAYLERGQYRGRPRVAEQRRQHLAETATCTCHRRCRNHAAQVI
mmetsp:Transcript_25135/g.74284  ORF Transcript_25135/g.74284 Transcript_25135/m.74284 type:complete len:266 (-) Transcript_25135:1375-2172(-)